MYYVDTGKKVRTLQTKNTLYQVSIFVVQSYGFYRSKSIFVGRWNHDRHHEKEIKLSIVISVQKHHIMI